MALSNPWYIDAEARHLAKQQRLLAYNAMEGQEGVMAPDHLAVKALATPAGGFQVMPGAYSVLAKHLGGAYEAYVGKIDVAETISVSPVSSGGPRTDLVILRIENPYVSGSGAWSQPADPIDGPYAHIRVIEGVPANTNHIAAYNNTWSAITLARITRPASTGIVDNAHITDLRSLAKLGEQRIIIIETPPAEPPPIAQQYWTESTPIGNNQELSSTQLSFVDFPNLAKWQVPVPAWAVGMDVNIILNPNITGDVVGEYRLVVSGTPTGSVPTDYDFNYNGGPGDERTVVMIGGTEYLEPSVRGKIVEMKLQARSTSGGSHSGKVKCRPGTRVNVWLNFKRYPVLSDGGS